MRFAVFFNRLTGKWMPLVVILCLFTGVVFSDTLGHLIFLVPYVFAFMTFSGAIRSSFRQMTGIARHPIPLIVSYAIIHIVMPLIALMAGKIFLPGCPSYISGIMLEYVMPAAVSSVMWCVVSGGDISFTLSIILLDTLTAPLVIPLSLHILTAAHVQIDFLDMMLDLIWMVALPALLAMLMNHFSHDRVGEKVSPVIAPFGKFALIFIITINSTRIAPFVRHITAVQFKVIAIIFTIAVLGYAGGWLAGFLLRKDSSTIVSMTFGCGMRNISAGAVIAAAYFPAETMFPVMAGTLFQQALASMFSHLLTKDQSS
jgi:predicted Na+-dependent transporter